MAQMKNVEPRIRRIEGFDVAVRYRTGRNIRDDKGSTPMYGFDRAAPDSVTVARWIKTRFRPSYVGYDVDVCDGYGDAVHGKTLLGTVRATYGEK